MPRLTTVFVLILAVFTISQSAARELNPKASIADTTAGVLGINHIGLSVKDLDKALAFYQQASGFELVRREKVANNPAADKLYAHDGVAYEVAVLKAPNMLFELTEFSHNADATSKRMPAQGPGMTHTCFQSPMEESGFDKFVKVGADVLSRYDQPVDLGGYGVTYAYAYDPEGNMIELEQLDGELLKRAGYDMSWQELDESLWMSQVALATHDIDALMGFYEKILGFEPYRRAELADNERADEIADVDNLHILGGWFRMNKTSKVIEIWQYINPITEEFTSTRKSSDLGYSFSIEVDDIQQEYQRMSKLGVEFDSEPVELGDFWQVYGRDLDGNVFSLRQLGAEADSRFSVREMDQLKIAEK
ncbi:MAG: VOC family protein [Pseudomonadota bacterium]